MDVLSNEGVTSNSILENTKDTQKHYQDVYAALDASLVASSGLLSVGVDVEIGEKSKDDPLDTSKLNPSASSRISISNVAQATVAPELRDLRAGQDFHNKLQTANAGLENMRSYLDQISDQVSVGANYTKNPLVQNAVDSINKIMEETTYGGELMYNTVGLYNDKPAIDVPEVSEVTGGVYSKIQSTIITNAQRVMLDESGVPSTKGTETFLISKSNSSKVYSFPKDTPLDKINQTIEDYTQDPTIKPLIHFENNGRGELAIVTDESNGPVEFADSLTVSSIDGSLFDVPLDTYSKEASGAYNQRDGRVVEGDKSVMRLGEDLNDTTFGTVSLAEGNVVEGVDVDNMRTSNHALNRAEQFNERLSSDRREGDGFAVTPVDPGASSGSLTAGSGLRDSARSTSTSNGFNGAAPAGGDDVMLLPEDNSTEPYLTMQQRQSGLVGGESLDQSSKVVGDEDATDMQSEQPERYQTMQQIQSGVLGGETLNQLTKLTAEVPAVNPIPLQVSGTASGEQDVTSNGNTGTEVYNNTIEVESNEGVAAVASEAQIGDAESTIEQGNLAQSTVNENRSLQNTETNTQADNDSAESTPLEPVANAAQGTLDDSARDQSSEQEESQQQMRDITVSQGLEYSGVNPVSQLERIEGVITETLAFTLRGQRGEMDFVIAAGVGVDTLSLAINSTSNITGVTANAANGRISLEGASANELEVTGGSENQGLTPIEVGGEVGGVEQAIGGVIVSDLDASSDVGMNENIAGANSLSVSGGLELNIDMSNLGAAEGRSQVYDINSFSNLDAPDELRDNPQLANRILSSAYRKLDTVQSNIESLSSVNLRNTLDVSNRIEDRMLDGVANGIESQAESEAALSQVTVGINNSVSGGYGSRSIATLNLLGSVEQGQNARAIERFNLSELNEPAYQLATAQAVANYGVELGVDNTIETEMSAEEAQNAQSLEDDRIGAVEQVTSLMQRIADSVEGARESALEIRDVLEIGVEKRDDLEDLVQRAEDRFFANIEYAKETIREFGREYERELYDDNMVEEDASEKLYTERQVQLGTPLAQSLVNPEIVLPSEATAEIAAEERVIQEDGAVDRYLDSVVETDTLNQRAGNLVVGASGIDPAGGNDGREVESAPAGVMDVATTAAPVAVTGAVQGNATQPTSIEGNEYTNIVKLFEGQLGTVMVHGQEYNMTSLEGNTLGMMENEPEVVKSVIDKALEDVEVVSRDIADLQVQELQELGGALMAAIDTYGSDQSASNPNVSAHARYVQE